MTTTRKPTASHFASGVVPELPLAAWGEIKNMGWDIPSYWAIDANNVPYGDFSGHGCSLKPVTFDILIRKIDTTGDSSYVRRLAGRKPKLPEWARVARDMGWTAPETFDFDRFEETE